MSSKTAFFLGKRKITGFIFTTIFFLLLIAATTTSTTIFAPAVNYGTGTGTNPVSVATCDFNGDGIPDVATANNGDGSVSILLGNVDGTFRAAVNYSLGTGIKPDSIICGDFNGKMSLATANSNNDNISVLLGNGDGTFQAAVTYDTGTGSSPISITKEDFNKDGKLDLATANLNTSEVSVLLGNGDGTFQAAMNYPVGPGINPYSIAAGDVSGDGKLAIVTANAGSNDVSVLLGNGDGTFQAAVTYATGDGVTTGITPLSIIIGDFNGDGKRDLATANNSNDISVLLNNGDGTFKTAVIYAAGNSPVAITTGDFNADSNADLVAANVMGNNISAFLGNGDGTFQTAANYAVGNLPYAVIAGDFSKDGIADLVVANDGSDTVSVLISASNPHTYSISGTVKTTAGSPLAGVTVNLSGSASATTTTDASGNYSFADLQNGNYTVIPGLAGQTFTPANSTVMVSDANKPGVNFTINPHTITATAGSNGTITPQGTVTVNYGGSQTFIMTPNEGYSIVDVVVDGTSVGAISTYTFTNVTANHTIAASYTYTIIASAGAGGAITPIGAVTVNPGASQTFTITPITGYHITNVVVDGISIGAVNTYTFNNVTANHTITSSFSNKYTITVTADIGGYITPSGAVKVNPGVSQTFTITPNTGYYIDIVRVDGVSVGAITTYTFTNVTADHTITAFFTLGNHYKIFNTLYGTAGTRLDMCTLCHAITFDPVQKIYVMGTAYLSDIIKQRQKGLTKSEALKNIEQLDSDGDGFSNITEIRALKYPGDPLDHP